jgi:hypothetical protein
MNDTIKLTCKELLVIGGILISMVGSLVYGYFLLKEGQKKNCWDMYSTEQEAILNCEGVNE